MKKIFSLKNRLLPIVIWVLSILISGICVFLSLEFNALYWFVFAWFLFIWVPIVLPTIALIIQTLKKEYSLVGFWIYFLYIFLWSIVAYYSYILLWLMFDGAMSV